MFDKLALAAALLVTACGHHGASHGASSHDGDHAADDGDHATGEAHGAPSEAGAELATLVPVSGVHAVHCGCILEDVAKCGNYIEIAGEMLPLEGDVGLGAMEFCGKEGLEAEVTGSVEEERFVATAFELVD